jgi:putative ubiquitin-RnfH superfamily antitoxin RatB of RatAB toxin-antitoxin module
MEPEVVKPEVVVTTKEESTMPEVTHVRVAWNVGESKLAPLTQFIDYSKNNITNARALYKKSEELNIQTTLASLSQFARAQIRKNAGIVVERKKTRIHVERQERIKTVQQDESVEILDRLIQDMKDLRQFFVATTQENAKLKSKLDKFRKFFED